jgi:energy-coupling factor transporter ATP-binding protein EcfA2
MKVNVTVQSPVPNTARARQLEAMFDVPRAQTSTLSWSGDVPLDERDWSVGLIVGPSGSGKSTVSRSLFGEPQHNDWTQGSVVDGFPASATMEQIAEVCQAVGFNTIPAWLRPYEVLSTGEKFRVDMARLLINNDDIMVMDEFTSTVDRQVAQIGSHAVQKYVRRNNRQFVAVTCHYDIIDWLQPDWVLELPTLTFTWRSLQQRPPVNVTIQNVPYASWRLFAPFHYLTADLNRTARCWTLFVDNEPAAFAGVLRRPHPKVNNIMGVSRLVTLPDWQGLGLAFVLADALGAIYRTNSERLRTYPAHPALIHSFDRSPLWRLAQKPAYGGTAKATVVGPNAKIGGRVRSTDGDNTRKDWAHGSRPCAVFEYVGPAHADRDEAKRLYDTRVR